MGRKLAQALQVNIPSYFRCPISLDVMRSPVSLCTGVTYDRASIQRWLDSGNTTCPATMLPLPSTDLVPNLTLRRLIRLWSSAYASCSPSSAVGDAPVAGEILLDLRSFSASGGDPIPPLRKLAEFLSSDEVDEFDKNNLVNAGGCASVVASVLHGDAVLEAKEAAITVLIVILTLDSMEESNKKITISELTSDARRSVSALTRVLRGGSSLESRTDAARVLDSIIAAADPECKFRISEEELVRELIRLIGPSDEKGTAMDQPAIDAGLACVVGLSASRRVMPLMVRMGVVAAVTRVLGAESAAATVEKALRVMAAASGCAEGRASICEDGAAAAMAVVRRMVKAGKAGAEAAVAVLWRVCHRFRDRRAVEAVAATEGVVTKLLLLMQSGCSPAARQMAADLLKIFRVSSKSCITGYDTKTTHIMPF
ncbi:hypothetical protein B296_00058035 [Ensete ventricosum]|uniref:U-box domain-containing protein n=1 Tax=Ensete ventricosum TaxID=4639 RepID=A0A426WYC8_ENSVE|nr:hypothetical protein B296_00058035 [Ensete ventricosum]